MSGCCLFCRPGALEYGNSHRRYEDLNGILTVIARTLLRALCPRIDIAIAAEFLAVTVENLFVFSIIRNADLMILVDKRGEVADDQKVFLLLCPPSHKYKHIFIGGNIVDPLKARRIVVLLVQRRLVMIKLQQCLHKIILRGQDWGSQYQHHHDLSGNMADPTPDSSPRSTRRTVRNPVP